MGCSKIVKKLLPGTPTPKESIFGDSSILYKPDDTLW